MAAHRRPCRCAELAHGRTGDKGNRSNISVIAYRAELSPLLVEQVTEERVARALRASPADARAALPAAEAARDELRDRRRARRRRQRLAQPRHPRQGARPSCCSTCSVRDLCRCSPATQADASITQQETSMSIRFDALAAALPLRRRGRAPARPRTIPTRPITFVVPFAAGSATDQIARALGQSVTAQAEAAGRGRQQAGRLRLHRGAGRRPRRRPTATPCSSPPTPRTRPTSTCTRSCPTTRSRTSRR